MSPEQEDPEDSHPAAIMSERRVALLGGMLAGLGPLSLALFTPAMPVIVEVFGATDAAVKGTLSVYFAGYACAQLVSGPLSDRYGRRPVMQAFLLAYLLGTFGTLLATTIQMMLWSRAVQGIGAAAGLVMSRAIVRDLFTGDRSARVLNFSNIVIGAGPTIAPAIGGAAMLVGGWRAPFVVMLLLGLALVALVQFALRETRPQGTVPGQSKGALCTYARLLRNPHFFWSSATIASSVATFYGQSTVLSFIIMGQLGYGAAQFGLLMLFISGGYFIGAIAVRWMIPRYGAARLVPVGLGLLLASSLMTMAILMPFPPTLLGVAVPVAVMVFANAFILPGMYTACLAPFADIAGAASAMTGFMTMGLGLIVSVCITQIPDPSVGLGWITPVATAMAVFSYMRWRLCGRKTG